ncbi:hypothetical protein IAT38_001346 [Cryptococcus sp. DSM 104549]
MSYHISPKSNMDGFDPAYDPRPHPQHTHSHPHTRPAAVPLNHTDTTSTSSTHTHPRSSTSSASSQSDSSATSSYSLPRYYDDVEASSAGEKKKKDKRSGSFAQRASARLINSLSFRSRRRSSLPLVHLARRKTTQVVLAAGILILGALLLRESSTHVTRKRLWDRDLALHEWDVRHSGDREVNLVALRADYEIQRRREIVDGKRAEGTTAVGRQVVWGPEDEEGLNREVAGKWPRWWGNPDVVGPSPFDHRPGQLMPGTPKRRFLMLTDYTDYLERMNTHTYEIVDAALRHPHLIVDVWGPGWAGYDRSIPLSANVRKRAHRLSQLEKSRAAAGEGNGEWVKPAWREEVPEECSDVRFDVVMTISNIYKETDPHLDALDCGALMVQQIGDCHELRCTYEWYPQSNNITLSKYAFELPELFAYNKVKERYPEWEMGLFGHSPDTGNEWDFWPVPWSEKTGDVRIFGFDGSFYPIRTTVTDYLRDLKPDSPPSIITRHPHPGYTVSVPQEARDTPLETYEPNHAYYQTHLKLREDFAKGMREAKICLFDASLERKMIRKYAQALLSGCVVAADLPTEQESALSKFVIPLKSTWPIDRINSALQYYLDRPDVLQQMAVDGLVYARQHLTTTNKISHVLEMADHYRQGSRGYEFPYGFSMRCRAYWGNQEGHKPAWCDGYRGLEE